MPAITHARVALPRERCGRRNRLNDSQTKSPYRSTAPPLASPRRPRPVTCSTAPHHVRFTRCKAESPPPSTVLASEGFPPESSATAFQSPDTLPVIRPSPVHKMFKDVFAATLSTQSATAAGDKSWASRRATILVSSHEAVLISLKHLFLEPVGRAHAGV